MHIVINVRGSEFECTKTHYLRNSLIVMGEIGGMITVMPSSKEKALRFKETLKACCGTGGLYDYNLSRACGYPPLRQCCNDPSSYMSWDGIHYTEAVNRLIANVVFEE
uniref:GDSL esterase/lipase n=1 Tax=Gossypium raimondii TaxID=29730 RepID=A0A0D2U1C6_GOSRA|nr:hypothetical protein B456_009G437500 [Gossypium raimondii]